LVAAGSLHWDLEEGMKMRMACMGCGRDVNLDHVIFDNYEGPVKCFCCGTIMEVKTVRGALDSMIVRTAAPVYLERQAVIAEAH
jgi:ribosomal protein S27E